MRKLILDDILVLNNKIEYRYSVEGDWSKYFKPEVPFWIQYEIDEVPLDLTGVPRGIIAVPFVCNILPIVWLADAELHISELDKSFFQSIEKFKQGYVEMYPDTHFGGIIKCENIRSYESTLENRSAVFFSGGVDSWCTLLRHVEEKPDLISLWGSDIPFNNYDGWRFLYKNLKRGAQQFNLPLITVQTTFRKVIDEGVLTRDFEPVLHDGWWHGAQHGIAIIAHAAPCNFVRGVRNQYIAATYDHLSIACASHPNIDNHVRFGFCRVFHDAFIPRTEKTSFIVNYCRANALNVDLHVCWETVDGNNCCNCEKCYRTIMGILVAGDFADNYGFLLNEDTLKKMDTFIRRDYPFTDKHKVALWQDIKEAFWANEENLKGKPYYTQIKWVGTFKFDTPNYYWRRRVKNIVQGGKRILWPIYGRPLRWLRNKKRLYHLGRALDRGEVYFIGTPEHSNIGDSAIALAELDFLERCGIKRKQICEITAREYEVARTSIRRHIAKNKPIFLIGGGNMGNQWMWEEIIRRTIVEDFPENPKVLFPQTIYYTPSPDGEAEKQNSVPFYNTSGFTLAAREQPSFDMMRGLYPSASVLLTPDIVLSVTSDSLGAEKQARRGVLLCMRSDVEKKLTEAQQEQILAEVNRLGLSCRITDMHTENPVTKETRRERVREKINEFTGAELVITDRLHGMIFAAITETPCIAFGNYNHKVAGTYEWLRHLPYVKYVTSVEEMKQVLPELLGMEDCRFDREPLIPYFEKLAEVVKETCR